MVVILLPFSSLQYSLSNCLENTHLRGDGLNCSALNHSRCRIIWIQISAPSFKIYTFPGLTIWLSTWFCIKSSIFCFTRVLVSHGDSWSHSWPVCPNAKNSLSQQARQKARQQMLLPRGTACALTARMCSAPLQGSSSAGFADVVSRAPKLQLLFQQWNLLLLHPNFLLPDLLGHLLREEQTLPHF